MKPQEFCLPPITKKKQTILTPAPLPAITILTTMHRSDWDQLLELLKGKFRMTDAKDWKRGQTASQALFKV